MNETEGESVTDKHTTVHKLSKNKVEIQDIPVPKQKREKKKQLSNIDLDVVEDHIGEPVETDDKERDDLTKVKEKKKKRRAKDQISDKEDGEDDEVRSKKKKRKGEKIHDETGNTEESEPVTTNETSRAKAVEDQDESEPRKVKKKRKTLHGDGPIDLEGFTVLGSHKPAQLPKVSQETAHLLTLSQTSPGFYVSEIQDFGKHSGKRRNCS